jgi:hypothetical protein
MGLGLSVPAVRFIPRAGRSSLTPVSWVGASTIGVQSNGMLYLLRYHRQT